MPCEKNLSFTQVRSKMVLDLSLESWEGRANSLVRARQVGVEHAQRQVFVWRVGKASVASTEWRSSFEVSFLH